MRGEKSEGFWIPAHSLGVSDFDLLKFVNQEFDTFNGQVILTKYVVRRNVNQTEKSENNKNSKADKKEDILIPGQFNFHIDTPQLGKNFWKLHPNNNIVITQKLHGASFICSKVLVKKKLSWKDKLAKFFGVSVVESEYKNLYSSRRVIKNLTDNVSGFYGKENIWEIVNNKVSCCLSDSMTIYGEAVGYLPSGKWIQRHYDYGCKPGEHKVYVYRITNTLPNGKVIEWSWNQIKSFCKVAGLETVPELFSGKASDLLSENSNHWNKDFLQFLKNKYLEKKCNLCNSDVPDEGIVLRVEDSLDFDVYKLKSFSFLERESKSLDSGEEDIESQESQMVEV